MMDPEQSPWICHVCDKKSTGESSVCSICYRTTCTAHLKRAPLFNKERGLYEINWLCVFCAAEELSR
jgi:hypothetical protein